MVRELQHNKIKAVQGKVESTVLVYKAGQIKGGSNCSLPLPLGEIEREWN